MKAEMRALTAAELEKVSGAQKDVGGYSYCWWPRQGLYAGGCPPTIDDMIGMAQQLGQTIIAAAPR